VKLDRVDSYKGSVHNPTHIFLYLDVTLDEGNRIVKLLNKYLHPVFWRIVSSAPLHTEKLSPLRLRIYIHDETKKFPIIRRLMRLAVYNKLAGD